MKTSDVLERVLLCQRTAFISNEIVDLQRVQCVSMSNGCLLYTSPSPRDS